MSKNKVRIVISWQSVLFPIFLVLKLTSVIDWSWWWVTSPLWLPITIYLIIFGIAVIGGLIYLYFSREKR